MAGDHAGRMDAIYATQRHFYDLTRKYYLLGRDALIDGLAPTAASTILEVGCGTARNLIAVARRWPDARCYGIDISEAMLATARAKVAEAGLAHRIVLAQGDATAFDPQALFGMAAFDRIFLSYTLSMIPRWQAAIDAAAGRLAPRGQLHLVDFGQQEGLPAAWRGVLFAWLRRFDVTPRADLRDRLEEIADAHRLMLDFSPRFRGYAWSGTLTRPG